MEIQRYTLKSVIGVLAATSAMLVIAGCDEGSSSSGSGQPIDKLADSPQSTYGKAAGYARDTVEDAEARSAAIDAAANEAGGGGGRVTAGGISWAVPGAWVQTQAGPMRDAQYEVPGGGTIYWSSGIGGSVQQNIDRWVGQMSGADARTEQQTIGGLKVTTVAMEGTYMDGPPMGQKVERDRWAFRGAVIEGGTQGLVFIKMTGPQPAIEAADGAWDSLIASTKRG